MSKSTDGEAAPMVLPLRRKRRPMPIPASACGVISDLGLGSPHTSFGVRFHLRRRKEGTEVTMIAGEFSWNLSVMLGHWPTTFGEARQWVRAYAAGYGQELKEAEPSRRRSLRATGEDAKLLKAGRCREAWLRSDVPTLFAETAIRCRSAAAACGAKGFCEYGTCDMEMDPESMQESEGASA